MLSIRNQWPRKKSSICGSLLLVAIKYIFHLADWSSKERNEKKRKETEDTGTAVKRNRREQKQASKNSKQLKREQSEQYTLGVVPESFWPAHQLQALSNFSLHNVSARHIIQQSTTHFPSLLPHSCTSQIPWTTRTSVLSLIWGLLILLFCPIVFHTFFSLLISYCSNISGSYYAVIPPTLLQSAWDILPPCYHISLVRFSWYFFMTV